jgi:hypothetical protein
MRELTVRDLIASKAVLQVVCRRCKHGALLFPRELIEVAGENSSVAEISKRLRCSKCKSAHVSVYAAAR